MRYPPHLLDEIRACLPVSQVVGVRLTWDRRKSQPARGDWWACCPFHEEKTPSFHADDRRGRYYCFGCKASGDVFKFVMESEGLSFPEAVERLAGEAGVVLPEPTAEMVEQEAERDRLTRLMEASACFFEAALQGATGGMTGGAARSYIEGRGLSSATIARFRIGYAPRARGALKSHLVEAGFTQDEMTQAGMIIAGPDIPVSYDRFRDRVVFPIADAHGRIIAFGGRALDSAHPAKYLNSPETPLFHKGEVLFNAAQARQAAFETGMLVAVEGYMDVVALVEAGIAPVVAPLGTALTERQIALMWRMAPEPILCFDGDKAGRKAAWRAIDTALPHLMPGRSLAIAFLPEGLDPDDLVRQEGAGTMQAVLDRARPLADALWEREWRAGMWTTPERRAALEQRLGALTGLVRDPGVRRQYERDMRERLFRALGGRARRLEARPGILRKAARGGGESRPARPQASASLRASALVSGPTGLPTTREAVLLCTLLNHPWLVDEYCEDIAELAFSSRAMTALRDGLLEVHAVTEPLDRTALRAHLEAKGLAKAIAIAECAIAHKSDRFVAPASAPEDVEVGWRHVLALHGGMHGLERELDAAERMWRTEGSPEAFERLKALRLGLDEARAHEIHAHETEAQGTGADGAEERGDESRQARTQG